MARFWVRFAAALESLLEPALGRKELANVLHLATNAGAIGTGHGRAGALVALVLGSIGLLLGALARTRSRRANVQERVAPDVRARPFGC